MRQRFLALDGIRGLAILAVLLTHASYIFQTGGLARLFVPLFKFGWSGVDLFFVLSGFLITGILIDTKDAIKKGLLLRPPHPANISHPLPDARPGAVRHGPLGLGNGGRRYSDVARSPLLSLLL
jgi:hypothetical protein